MDKFIRLTSITGDYRSALIPVFEEILSMDYRGRIITDEGEDLILASFTYPYNPATGCGKDGQVYLFVSRFDVEILA